MHISTDPGFCMSFRNKFGAACCFNLTVITHKLPVKERLEYKNKCKITALLKWLQSA